LGREMEGSLQSVVSSANVVQGRIQAENRTLVHFSLKEHTGWAKKVSLIFFNNNFVNCQPIFIIFGTHILEEICNQKMYSLPTSPGLCGGVRVV